MAATGVGKTYIGVRAAKYAVRKLGVQKILIVVPTTNLRDNEWPNEFKK